jgi:hypothetical protein
MRSGMKPLTWIEKPLENWPTFIKNREIGQKTRETGGDRCHWYFKNRAIKFEIFKKFKKLEIKKSKKTRVHFKNFLNIIQNFKITCPTKFDEGKNVEKI